MHVTYQKKSDTIKGTVNVSKFRTGHRQMARQVFGDRRLHRQRTRAARFRAATDTN